MLAVGAEQYRYELSQQQLMYTVLIVGSLIYTVHTLNQMLQWGFYILHIKKCVILLNLPSLFIPFLLYKCTYVHTAGIAGTDGMSVSARSWTSVANAGTRKADAPQGDKQTL